MVWTPAGRQHIEALDEKIAALGARIDDMQARALDEKVDAIARRLDELGSRLDRLADATEPLSADVERALDRLAEQDSRHDEQTGRLSSLADEVAGLREADRATADTVGGHGSRIEALRDDGAGQRRSLDQLRADLVRIERQTAIDLAELRRTSMALTRTVLGAGGSRDPLNAVP